MQLRPYQLEAIEALDQHWRTHDDNPLLILPTGSGKTIVLAEIIRRYLSEFPALRICVLVHVRELVKQNACKLAEHWPEAPLGIYSASLGARDTHAAVIFASIQSVYRRARELGRFDLVFIDEAHRVPLKGDGQYRHFLSEARELNPNLRITGLTATPYRLGPGLVYGPDYILNSVAYEAPVRRLIDDGYLCRLTSKATETSATGAGVAVRGGEYVARELEDSVDDADLVRRAVAEMVSRLADRKAWIIFCAGVRHATNVARKLASHGIEAPVIEANTPAHERERWIATFNAGLVRALCNVNVLSEGFDAPHVDAVVLLRPTKSAGLYYQQVGRGFRLHPEKDNCLVLDFAGNVREHGPVDLIRVRDKPKRGESATQGAPTKECPQCHELIHLSLMRCPECGHEWPAPEVKHDDRPDDAPVLSQPPARLTVGSVHYSKHMSRSSGAASLRVDYRCGIQRITEWVCIGYHGYSGNKADAWWGWRRIADRHGQARPADADEALALIERFGLREPTYLHVDANGKYPKITRFEWDEGVDAQPQGPAGGGTGAGAGDSARAA